MAPKPDDVIFTELLSKILWEEFNRDGWGDIDPYLFRYLADRETDFPSDLDIDTVNDVRALRSVLERVCERLRRPLE